MHFILSSSSGKRISMAGFNSTVTQNVGFSRALMDGFTCDLSKLRLGFYPSYRRSTKLTLPQFRTYLSLLHPCIRASAAPVLAQSPRCLDRRILMLRNDFSSLARSASFSKTHTTDVESRRASLHQESSTRREVTPTDLVLALESDPVVVHRRS